MIAKLLWRTKYYGVVVYQNPSGSKLCGKERRFRFCLFAGTGHHRRSDSCGGWNRLPAARHAKGFGR
jgi:hypothetical protein